MDSPYGIEVKTLGEGSLGVVKLYEKDGKNYAVKFQQNNGTGVDDSVIMEAAIMFSLDHPNVVKLLQVDFLVTKPVQLPPSTVKLPPIISTVKPPPIVSTVKLPPIISLNIKLLGKSVLIMPMADYDLKFHEPMAQDYINWTVYQMIRSVAYIHSQGIIHKDIKPQNFLYHKDTNAVWLADFGLSRFNHCHDANVTGSAYTLPYRSPETTKSYIISDATDIWALGATIIEVVTSKILFISDNEYWHDKTTSSLFGGPTEESYDAIVDDIITFPLNGDVYDERREILSRLAQFKEEVSDELYNMTVQMLSYNPTDRPTAFDLLNNSYFDELALVITTDLPSKEPEMQLDCISKLDLRSYYPSSTVLTANTESRIHLIKAADILTLDYMSNDSLFLALYLMDEFELIPKVVSEETKYVVALKIATGIYGPHFTYNFLDLMIDLDFPDETLYKDIVPYEIVALNYVIKKLNISTCYMYLVEYSRQLGYTDILQESTMVLKLLSISNIRFMLDLSALAIAAVYTAVNITNNDINDALNVKVKLIHYEINEAYKFYIKHQSDPEYQTSG